MVLECWTAYERSCAVHGATKIKHPAYAKRSCALSNLLLLQASPRTTESRCIHIAETYLDALRANNPDLNIDTLDLWEAMLAERDRSASERR